MSKQTPSKQTPSEQNPSEQNPSESIKDDLHLAVAGNPTLTLKTFGLQALVCNRQDSNECTILFLNALQSEVVEATNKKKSFPHSAYIFIRDYNPSKFAGLGAEKITYLEYNFRNGEHNGALIPLYNQDIFIDFTKFGTSATTTSDLRTVLNTKTITNGGAGYDVPNELFALPIPAAFRSRVIARIKLRGGDLSATDLSTGVTHKFTYDGLGTSGVEYATSLTYQWFIKSRMDSTVLLTLHDLDVPKATTTNDEIFQLNVSQSLEIRIFNEPPKTLHLNPDSSIESSKKVYYDSDFNLVYKATAQGQVSLPANSPLTPKVYLPAPPTEPTIGGTLGPKPLICSFAQFNDNGNA